MRAREFVTETASAGASSAGSVAAVSMPLGQTISRQASVYPTKYQNSLKTRKKLKK
jgi:cephalosporin-C deacetylase-like acetyl esterase